jgi:beta-mannosidase
MKTHQKHPRGFELIDLYMKRNFPVPENFEDYVYVSQLVQAEGIKKAIEAHRRAKPYCMGTLYWQLNDCWPVVSWSSVDYYGNWKALHYYVQDAFQDVMVSIEKRDTILDVFVVNDLAEALNCSIYSRLIGFDGSILYSDSIDIEISPDASAVCISLSFYPALICDSNRSLLNIRLVDQQGKEVAKSNYYFTGFKNLDLPEPEIKMNIRRNDSELEINFSTGNLVKNLFIWADFPAKFSDNFFDLLPGEERLIWIESDNIPENFKEKIHYVCLNEIE